MDKHKDAVIAGLDYERFINALKSRIQTTRLSASRVVYREMILLYWDIGHSIVEKQRSLGWGDSVVEQTSKDLRRAFPEMTGLSPRNVWDMKRFYLAYADESIWQQVVARLEKRQASAILQQAVAELGGRQVSSIRRQPVAKLERVHVSAFLRQAVAEATVRYPPHSAVREVRFNYGRFATINRAGHRALRHSGVFPGRAA